jgi:hypothetical protein
MATKSTKTGAPAAPHSPRPTTETSSSPTTTSAPAAPMSVATGGIAFIAGGTARPARSLSSVSLPWLIAEVDGVATRVASRVVRRRTGRRIKDGVTVQARGVTSPGRGSSGQQQFSVDRATFDEIDRHRSVVAAATIDEIEQRCEDLSVASTVDADNTHPYLLRHADVYAQGVDAGSVDTPTFIGVKLSPKFKQAYLFKEGQKVLYTSSSGPKEAIVMKVLYDTESQPYYEIKLVETDKEEATDSDKLDQKTTEGAVDKNGDSLDKCVNFKTDPTPLFQSLYQGKWQDAEERLANYPEEATIWVARYGKSNNGSYDEENVRWKLLPLHLLIAKLGLLEAKSDIHDDEDDAIQEEKTLKIIADLLSAYPQATQSRDDQNMIPLHQCIRGNCSLSIIDKLLAVDPSSVYTKDARGRNAFNLADKVYGKSIRGQQAGSKDTGKLVKYGGLMALLSDAANRIASPKASEPKFKAHGKHVEQDENVHELLQELRLENLTMRKENAKLRNRVDKNACILKELVEMLQVYEEERSVENYKEIFGSKDDFVARREEIFRSISQDDSEEMVKDNKQTKEKKTVGGDGAYYKRRERYHLSLHTGNEGNINVMSPSSWVTDATEPATPLSFDEDYTATYASAVELVTAFEVNGDEQKDVHDKESALPSENKVTSNTKMEGESIFRSAGVIVSSESPAMLPGLSHEEVELLQVE